MNPTWRIGQLIVKPTDGDRANVVIISDWTCSGQEIVGEVSHNGSCYGTASFGPPSDDFTEFDDLTKDQVLGWIWASGVDKDAIEANVADQIERSKNPPTVSLPPPWSE